MHFAVTCIVYNLAFVPIQIYQIHSDCQDIFKKLAKTNAVVLYLILEMPLRRIENAHDFGNYFRAFCRTFLSPHSTRFCYFFDDSQSCRMVKKTLRRVQLLIS